MHRVFLFLMIITSAACNQTTPLGEATVEGLAELPVGAEKEPYDDNPNRVKVTLKTPDGKTTAEGDYLNGKKHGTWMELYSNELVRATTSYIDGIKQGPHSTVDDRGQLILKAFFNQGEYHGDYILYNRALIKERRFYINGKLEGKVMKYYDNGNILEESLYSKGKLNGISRWYDQEGNVTLEYEYDNGTLLKK